MIYSAVIEGIGFKYQHETADDKYDDPIDFLIAGEDTVEEYEKSGAKIYEKYAVTVRSSLGNVKSMEVVKRMVPQYRATDLDEKAGL